MRFCPHAIRLNRIRRASLLSCLSKALCAHIQVSGAESWTCQHTVFIIHSSQDLDAAPLPLAGYPQRRQPATGESEVVPYAEKWTELEDSMLREMS